MEKINKCICGRTPKFKSERVCYAHGEFPLEGWIECKCGMKTKSFIIDGFYGCTDTEETVIEFWNKKMDDILIKAIERLRKENDNGKDRETRNNE